MKTFKNHLAFILLFATLVSKAAIYLVDTTLDLPDDDISDEVCDTGLSANTPICSLRAAIMQANATQGVDDIIALPNNKGSYFLTRIDEDDDAFKGDLDITDNISIINGTQSGATIDGNYIDRVFQIHSGSRLTLQGINIKNGLANTEKASQGGAIMIQEGELVADRMTLSNNISNRGGAIAAFESTINITNSYIHHNAVSDAQFVNLPLASAIFLFNSQAEINKTTLADNIEPLSNPQFVPINSTNSAIYSSGIQSDLMIYNSTVANHYIGISFSGGNTLDINQATIANNSSYGLRAISGETLILERSLFANNDKSCLIGILNFNYTIERNGSTDSSCSFISNSNIINMQNPLQQTLNNWGGYAPTLMLHPNSQAIDSIGTCNLDLMEDQRGGDRPINGNDDMFAFCDMGAIEFNPETDNDIIFVNGFE